MYVCVRVCVSEHLPSARGLGWRERGGQREEVRVGAEDCVCCEDLGFYPGTWEPWRAGGGEDLTQLLPWLAMGEYLVWLCHVNGMGCPWH